ncbi:MAG: hypothetical protein HAW60_01570 [Bdellovibrionales bacterium]|nr:hypothetical protein [Bdellovibrionales bacterium]
MYFLLFLSLFLFNQPSAFAAGLIPNLPGEKMPAFNKNFKCIADYKAKTYIKDYNIDFNSFGGLELCDNSVDTKKLFNDLDIVENGYFSGNKTNIFIQGFVKASEYDYWLKTMTRGIRRGNDVPYATAYNSGGYFTMQDGWSKLSTLGRVGTLVHEARHTEGYRHRACTHGPYSQSSLSGCDASVERGGSHGVEMEYYSRVVLQGQNFHPAYTSMARLMNLARANFVFNKYAMKQKEALFVLTNKKALVLKDNKKIPIFLSKKMLSQSNYLKLKRTSHGANLFGLNTALAFDIYSWSKKIQTNLIEDVYSYYKMIKQDKKISIIDLEEVDFGKVRHLVALTSDSNIMVYNFPKGRWYPKFKVAEGSSLKTISPDGKKGLFLVTKQMFVHPFDTTILKFKHSLDIKWPANVKSYNLWNADLLELRNDKKIYYTNSGSVFSVTDEDIVDFVKIPLYDSFDL